MSNQLPKQSYQRGVIYLLIAGLFMSTSGVFVRMIEQADPWAVLFYRSLTFAATVFAFMRLRSGKSALQEFRGFGLLDCLVAISVAISFICYLLSLFNTSVANTVIIVSTGPLFAAALGWVVLKERVRVGTWVSIALAIMGMLVMFTGQISAADIVGMLYALLAVFCFAIMIVSIRRSSRPDMLAATACAGLCAAAISFFASPDLTVSNHDLLLAVCLGFIQIGFGFILITLGSRSVPSAQVPLLCMLETAFAPLWVWFSVNEVPTQTTLLGGALVLSAVLFQGLLGISRRRASAD
jgi:drug/metabolite transporter (DMT)-like permease